MSLLSLLTFAFLLGDACRKKPPKLTPAECDRFCRRLVPCFAKRMANFSMRIEDDIRECIQNCNSKEGQKHGQLLRAMKNCGHLKDCDKLYHCFQKTL